MKKITVPLAVLPLLSLAASLCGCGSDDNAPLPKGEVPEWRQNNAKAADHPHDPNMRPGEK